MPVEESSGRCAQCRKQVLIRRPIPNHWMHGIFSLLTLPLCGGWLWIWAAVTFFGVQPWRCTHCGAEVGDDHHRQVSRNLIGLAVVIILLAMVVAGRLLLFRTGSASASAQPEPDRVALADRVDREFARCKELMAAGDLDAAGSALSSAQDALRQTLALELTGEERHASELARADLEKLALFLAQLREARTVEAQRAQVRQIEENARRKEAANRDQQRKAMAARERAERSANDRAFEEQQREEQRLALELAEKDEREQAKKQRERAKEKVETAAAAKLKLARSLLAEGNRFAKVRLQQVVDEFPDTKAAAEARKLLNNLPDPPSP